MLTQQGFQVAPQKGGIQTDQNDMMILSRAPVFAGLAVQALATGVSVRWEGGITASFTNIVNEGMARQAAQQRSLLENPEARPKTRIYYHFALRFAHA